MANIKAAIQLFDGVSSPAAKMADVLTTVMEAFEGVENASNSAINTAKFDEARQKAYALDAELQEIGRQTQQNQEKQEKHNNKLSEGVNAGGKLKSVLAAVGAGLSIKGIIDLTDSMTTTTAKLNLINDGLQTTEELQNKIFASANRSRASYQSTADAVARFGANVKDAFSSTDEIIAFAEQVNKQFVLSGTEAAAASGAMTQLTQALGSGVLRGDELNSIFEAAPTLIHAVAKEMGVGVGQIRELASEGKITANIVKNAMLNAAEETNAKFESMPMTFAQVWQKVQNNLLKAFNPIIQTIGKAADWIADNWGTLEPIFYGLAGAVAAYGVATLAAKVAQEGLNLAFLASPVTWIAVGVGALIMVIKKLADSVGGFGNLWTLVCGYVEAGWNYFVYGVFWGVDKIELAFEAAGKFFYRIGNSIATFFDNLWAGIVSGAEWCVNQLIDALNTIVKITNPILSSLGQDGMVVQHAHFAADTREAMNNRIAERNNAYAAYADNIATNQANRTALIASVKHTADTAVSDARAKIAANQTSTAAEQTYEEAFGSLGGTSTAGDIADNAADTAANTARTADSLESVSMDLSFLRELAERRAVSQYTNANVTLDMSGMQNSFSNDMDVDGFMEIVTVKLDEALNSSTEGVHW